MKFDFIFTAVCTTRQQYLTITCQHHQSHWKLKGNSILYWGFMKQPKFLIFKRTTYAIAKTQVFTVCWDNYWWCIMYWHYKLNCPFILSIDVRKMHEHAHFHSNWCSALSSNLNTTAAETVGTRCFDTEKWKESCFVAFSRQVGESRDAETLVRQSFVSKDIRYFMHE